MRHLLTAIGILLAIALAAAMAVPHFVDFSRFRAAFETHIQTLTGQPARIEGPIKLRLLPTPTLSMQNVKFGAQDAQGFAMFEADRVYGALAPTSLLRGEFQITEASVDAPIMRVGAQTSVVPPKPGLPNNEDAAKLISIEKLTISAGTLIIARPGREALTVSDIAGEFEATSLAGPARGSADFFFEGGKRHIRFALGKIEGGKTRVKALIEDIQLALKLDIDGTLGLGQDAAERFDGTAVLVANTALGEQERVQLPLRVTTKAKLAGNDLSLGELEVLIGQGGQPLTLTGKGAVTLGNVPQYDLVLSAKSYDFDRPGPDGRPKRVAPVELIREFAALMPQGTGSAFDVEGKVDVSAGALIVAGQTVVSPRAVLEQKSGEVRVMTLDGDLPGQTRVEFRAAPQTPGMLSGSILIDSRDPEKLHGWFNGIQRNATAAAATAVRADLRSVRDGVSVERVQIVRGSSTLNGKGEYLLPRPGLRPAARMTMALTTPQLAIGDIPAFVIGSERRETKPDFDFDVTLDAAQLALDGQNKGKLTAKVRRDGEITSIERVEIAGLDGASLIASGTLGGGSRRVTIKLDAQKIEAVTAIVQQVFPGSFSDGLRRRSDALAPALFVATLSNEEAGDTFQLDVDGNFGGTDIKGNGELVAKADIFIDLKASISNADSGRLAQQLSGSERRASSNVPASGTFAMRGNPRASVETRLAGGIFGLDAEVSGQIKLFQPLTPFEGTMSARSADIYPALAAVGIDPAFLTRGARGSVVGKVESNLQKITLTGMVAQLGGTQVTGEVAFNLGQASTIAGQLKLQELDLKPVLAPVLGVSPVLFTSAGWSSAAFGKVMAPPLSGDLWIEAERVRLSDGTVLDQPRSVVRFSNNAISFEHGSFRYQSARIAGELLMRRGGETMFATSKLTFADLDAEKFGLAIKGMADGELQLSGSGNSPLKLAQGLAGTGQIKVRNVTIPNQDAGALDRLLAVPIAKFGPTDAQSIARRLEAELAKGPLTIAEARFPVVIIDGVARFSPASVDALQSVQDLSGSFDLARMQADFRVTASDKEPPEPWREAVATTQWRGSLSSLTRSIGVEQLVNGFLAAALQKDAELRDIQEQDLRERAYFNRRLKLIEAEKRRAEDEKQEAQRAEQARVVAERQRAAEAARAKAQQEEAQRQRAAEEADKQKLRDIIEQGPPQGSTAPARPDIGE